MNDIANLFSPGRDWHRAGVLLFDGDGGAHD
jgi:hypothetical protein